jgi:Domain of unknown function (DUF1905)
MRARWRPGCRAADQAARAQIPLQGPLGRRHESARPAVRLTHFRHGGAFPAHGRIFDDGGIERTFAGEVIEWRGPAPYLFVAMAPEESEDLKEEACGLIYWGQVPVHVAIGGIEFITALFPRDGCYLMPRQATFCLVGGVTRGWALGRVTRRPINRHRLPRGWRPYRRGVP